ncbi:MAG: CpsD/CapB family tyrosine-protein kinase [Bradymonadia bacterium]
MITLLDVDGSPPADDSVDPVASTVDGDLSNPQAIRALNGDMFEVPEDERVEALEPFNPVTVDDVIITPIPRQGPGPRVPRTDMLTSLTPEGEVRMQPDPQGTPVPHMPHQPVVVSSDQPVVVTPEQDDEKATLPFIESMRSELPPLVTRDERGPMVSTRDEDMVNETVHEIVPVGQTHGSIMELPVHQVAERVVALAEPDGPFLTQFRILKRNLEQAVDRLNYRTIAVTSTCSQEGRTTTAMNLAVVMSENPWLKIAVVDLHLRKPSVARRLGMPSNSPGILEVLGGDVPLERALRKLEHRNLYFLHAGHGSDISLQVLNSPQFDVMLDHLQQLFDLIIIDAPPLLGQDDALVIYDKVDGMLFVLRAEFTDLRDVERALERIGRERLLGVILNDVRPEEVG